MTLTGLMAVILRYFSEFGYLPGVLRKSSRSLSHLLMSSCDEFMDETRPGKRRRSCVERKPDATAAEGFPDSFCMRSYA